MKNWLISIAVTVIITTSLSMLLPGGKTKNFIKGTFSLLLMWVIMQPVVNFKNSGIKLDNLENKDEVVLQYDYLGYIAQEKIEYYEKDCRKILEEIGIKNASVIIKYYMTEKGEVSIEKVKIILYDSVIVSDKEHIDIIEEIKVKLSDYLNVGRDLVVIYER